MSEDKAQKAKKEEDIKEDSKLEEVELNDEKEIKTVLKKEDNKKENKESKKEKSEEKNKKMKKKKVIFFQTLMMRNCQKKLKLS